MAKIKEDMEIKAYRAYVSDTLLLIAENTALAVRGKYPKQRYVEIVSPKPLETRTADEIINSFKQKLGGGQK